VSLFTVLGVIFIAWGIYTMKAGRAGFNTNLLDFKKNVVYTRTEKPVHFWISVLVRVIAGIMMIYVDL